MYDNTQPNCASVVLSIQSNRTFMGPTVASDFTTSSSAYEFFVNWKLVSYRNRPTFQNGALFALSETCRYVDMLPVEDSFYVVRCRDWFNVPVVLVIIFDFSRYHQWRHHQRWHLCRRRQGRHCCQWRYLYRHQQWHQYRRQRWHLCCRWQRRYCR